MFLYTDIGQEKKNSKKFKKIKKEIKNVEVLYEIVDFFVLDMCFKPWGLYFAQKLLRKAKPQVARTAKICSKRQKLLKSCQAQSGKAYPGLIHYVALICENVSLDWSTMQLVGNYGCQYNAGSGSIFLLKNAVLGLGLGFG